MTEQNRIILLAFLDSIDLDDLYAEEITASGGLVKYMFDWLYADPDNRAYCEEDGFPEDRIMPILAMEGALEIVLKRADEYRAELDEDSEDYCNGDYYYDLARERACYERGF
tara:strand:+ start:107 stop:442 length:336 start_codon:yes stop_codon:yes gene_type:complete